MGLWGNAQATPAGTDPLRMEIESLLSSYRLDSAAIRISQMPREGYRAYYQVNLLVYRHLGKQEEYSFKRLQDRWTPYVRAIESLPKDDPLREVMLGEVFCKRALLEFLHHNYLSAANYARMGRSHINKNAKLHPRNVEQLKMLGLFNVVLGAVPRRYQWLTNILGFNGDLNIGIAQLTQAAESGQLMGLEAEVILYHVEKNILNQTEEALARLRRVRSRIGSNLMLDYFLATGLMSVKKNEAALRVLLRRNLYTRNGVFFIPFWDYQLGKAYYYRGDMSRARRYLARFVRDYEGKMFRTDAHFRLGMALTLSGHYDIGRTFFEAVANPEESFDEDAYAQHMASRFARQKPTEAVQTLFRARNYYDGGYLDRAITTLNLLTPAKLSSDDRAEWHYRMGRILHTQGKLVAAQQSYEACLTQPVSQPHRWLHAYSCYFQGEIARQREDYVQARDRFQKALSYDNFFYQDGLENRSKAALSELKRAKKGK